MTRRTLALAVVAALAAGSFGAPVPPVPKELTAEMLAGTWRYEYGAMLDGTMWLYPDGTYCAVHVTGGPVYLGDWYADGAALVIREWHYCPESGRRGGPNTYRFAFDVSRFPRLAGQSNGGTRVVLSEPRR